MAKGIDPTGSQHPNDALLTNGGTPLSADSHNSDSAAQPIYNRAVYTFCGAHFLNDLVTTGMVPALVVMYKHAFHLNYTGATLIVLVSYLTSSVVQPVFGTIADRVPRVWLFSAGVFLSIFGLSLTGIAPSLPWLLVFVTISGVGSGVFHPEASRGTHFAAGSHKGLAQAIFQVGGNAGQAVGPLMIPLFLTRTGIHGLIWFAILAVLSLGFTGQIVPWLDKQVRQTIRQRTDAAAGENQIGGVVLLVIVIIMRSWCQIGVVVFLPFYLHHLSLSASETLNFVFVGAGALGTFLGGMWSDFLGLKKLLVGSMFLAFPFAMLFPHLHGALSVIDLLCFGFCVLSSFSVTVVYMQKLLPRNLAMASGLSIGFGVGAGGIASIMMGGISDVFGVPTVFTILSVVPLIGGIVALCLPSDRKPATARG